MDLYSLRYFVSCCENGSFRKAAVLLGIQESNVSRRVRDLETELGTSLFSRRSTGVTLTFAGQRFLPKAQAILRHVTAAAEEIASISSSKEGRVQIGISTSLASGFLSNLLREFAKGHHQVKAEITGGSTVEHLVAIRELRMDVAFMADAPGWPDCDVSTLWSERLILAIPEGHELAEKDEIRWSDLLDQSLIETDRFGDEGIGIRMRRRLEEAGSDPAIRSHRVGSDNLMSLVAMGWGLAFTTEAMSATQIPGIAYRPMLDEEVKFSAVWLRGNDNPALRHLLAMARAMSSKLPAG